MSARRESVRILGTPPHFTLSLSLSSHVCDADGGGRIKRREAVKIIIHMPGSTYGRCFQMTTTLVLGLIAPAICFFICALAHFHALNNKTPAVDILFFESNNERSGICMVLNILSCQQNLNAFVMTCKFQIGQKSMKFMFCWNNCCDVHHIPKS
jgi:hypothetical protein